MKKILFPLFSILILFSCKRKDINADISTKNPIVCDSKGEFMVIDDSKLEDSTKWKDDNKNLICTYSNAFKSCNKNETVVNLLMINDINDRAKWLTDNCKYICFDDSYKFIEDIHFLPLSTAQISVLNNNPATLTKQQLDDKIKFVSDTDTKDDYDKWVSFNIDKTNNSIIINELTTFDKNAHCFSIPLLKRILKNLKMEDKISFYETNIEGINIFLLNTDNRTFYFYNYSIKPQILKAIMSLK